MAAATQPKSDDSALWVVFVFIPAFLGAIIGPLVSDATFTRSAAVAGLCGFGLMLVVAMLLHIMDRPSRIAVPVEYEEDAA